MKTPAILRDIGRFLWKADSVVSSSVFETWDYIKRKASAYSSFVYRFKVTGLRRIFVDLIDEIGRAHV